MKAKGYVVAWEIFLEAASAEEAVKEAMACLCPREPEKWLFGVTDLSTGRQQNFDQLNPTIPAKTMKQQPNKEAKP